MQTSNLPRPGDILLARVEFQETKGEKTRPVLVLEVENGRVHYAYGTSQVQKGLNRGEFVVDPLQPGVAGKAQLIKPTKFCLNKTYWSNWTDGSFAGSRVLGNVIEISSLKRDLLRAIQEVTSH